jgi:glucans biosynthesis protein
VQLIEIPTNRESNDNIVALWRPKNPLPAGKPWHASYRMRWLPQPRSAAAVGRVSGTRSGPSPDGKKRLFVVDFDGMGKSIDGLTIDVGASRGKISNAVLHRFPALRSIRASFELAPGEADVAELRLRLMRGDRPATETWLYRWTPG